MQGINGIFLTLNFLLAQMVHEGVDYQLPRCTGVESQIIFRTINYQCFALELCQCGSLSR